MGDILDTATVTVEPEPEKLSALVALLDDEGVFQGMVPRPTQLTAAHLGQIPECDLPPGQYKWVAHGEGPFGGEFVSVALLAKMKAARDRLVDEAEAALGKAAQIKNIGTASADRQALLDAASLTRAKLDLELKAKGE